jgi:hypothetical protein
MRSILASLLVVASACGGKTKQEPVGPDTGSGDEQVACEPGRCLPDISKAVAERRDDARKCYEEGRKRDP